VIDSGGGGTYSPWHGWRHRLTGLQDRRRGQSSTLSHRPLGHVQFFTLRFISLNFDFL
jgi:hypothetical protein